jgi:hypothetical protein
MAAAVAPAGLLCASDNAATLSPPKVNLSAQKETLCQKNLAAQKWMRPDIDPAAPSKHRLGRLVKNRS